MKPNFPATATLFLTAACGGSTGGGPPRDDPASKPRLVRVIELEPRPVEERLPCTGHLESFHRVDLVARVNAQVVAVPAEEGSRAGRGEVLVRFDDSIARLNLESAKIREKQAAEAVEEAELIVEEARKRLRQAELDLEQAARDHRRKEEGVAKKLYGRKELEDAKLAHERAKNDLELARSALAKAELGRRKARTSLEAARVDRRLKERELEDYEVRAPFAGLVAALAVRGGEWVAPQRVVGSLLDDRDLVVHLVRPQRELGRIHPGLEVELSFDAFPGRRFTAEIDWISPTVDVETGTFTARARVRDPKGELHPGLFARAWIVTGKSRAALMIPKTAILYEGEAPFAFVVRDGRAVRLPIEPGIETRSALEARNVSKVPSPGRFQPGDLLVVEGQSDLDDGRPVRLVRAAKARPAAAGGSNHGKSGD